MIKYEKKKVGIIRFLGERKAVPLYSVSREIKLVNGDQRIDTGTVGLAPNWVRLDPKLGKSGTISDPIAVPLARSAKCTEIWSEKVPDLSIMGSNLTHFGAKPTIPASHVVDIRLSWMFSILKFVAILQCLAIMSVLSFKRETFCYIITSLFWLHIMNDN